MLWVNLTESAINVDSPFGIVRAPPWAQDQQQSVAEEPLEAWKPKSMDGKHLVAQRSRVIMAVMVPGQLDRWAPSGQLPHDHMKWDMWTCCDWSPQPVHPQDQPAGVCWPSPVCVWSSSRMEERFSTRVEGVLAWLTPLGSFSLPQPLLGRSDVCRSDMQDCDFLFVFSDKADGLAFNTNSLTDSRTSPDDYNLRFNISATDIYPVV